MIKRLRESPAPQPNGCRIGRRRNRDRHRHRRPICWVLDGFKFSHQDFFVDKDVCSQRLRQFIQLYARARVQLNNRLP
jgi:hypothetical protein